MDTYKEVSVARFEGSHLLGIEMRLILFNIFFSFTVNSRRHVVLVFLLVLAIKQRHITSH